MTDAVHLHLGLDDLLADLRHARRSGDLGRLALIAYCEVRRWAREAGEAELAGLSTAMFTGMPHASREVFLEQIDDLIERLERRHPMFAAPGAAGGQPATGGR